MPITIESIKMISPSEDEDFLAAAGAMMAKAVAPNNVVVTKTETKKDDEKIEGEETGKEDNPEPPEDLDVQTAAAEAKEAKTSEVKDPTADMPAETPTEAMPTDVSASDVPTADVAIKEEGTPATEEGAATTEEGATEFASATPEAVETETEQPTVEEDDKMQVDNPVEEMDVAAHADEVHEV